MYLCVAVHGAETEDLQSSVALLIERSRFRKNTNLHIHVLFFINTYTHIYNKITLNEL